MIKIVLDANQFVSALLKPASNPARILDLVRSGKVFKKD
jgi:predicted nucleic acid-binding protein